MNFLIKEEKMYREVLFFIISKRKIKLYLQPHKFTFMRFLISDKIQIKNAITSIYNSANATIF
jgi:hypothetical protein